MDGAHSRSAGARSLSERLDGTVGNEILTSAAAIVLTVLLAAEGVTILNVGALRTPHMFIGMVLIPPILVKLGSTGYRFARYYLGARAYREKGTPLLPLRLLAPLLVLATVGIFASGVALLIVGHHSDSLLALHKVSFIVWAGCFAAHFLAHLPRMLRSVGADWAPGRRREVPGAPIRLALVGGSIAAGLALAVAVLPSITGWHGGPSF